MAGPNGTTTTNNDDDQPVEPRTLPALARNRYFKGKLLTVSDFRDEQLYNIEKLAMIDRLVVGPGILCGLKAGLGTDKENKAAITVSPGAAIDAVGREIVVPSLATITSGGLKDVMDPVPGPNKSFVQYLCLEYGEDKSQPVTSLTNAAGCQEGCDYGRKNEKATFKLCSALPDTSTTAFCSGDLIFKNSQFKVERFVPHWVHQNDVFEARLVVTALADKASVDLTVVETLPGTLESPTPSETAPAVAKGGRAAAAKTTQAAPGVAAGGGTVQRRLQGGGNPTDVVGTVIAHKSYLMRAVGSPDEQAKQITTNITPAAGTEANTVTPKDSDVTITESPILDKIVEDYFVKNPRDCEAKPSDTSICLGRVSLSTDGDSNVSIQDVKPLPELRYAYNLPFLFGALACIDGRTVQPPPVSVSDHDTPRVGILATLRIADGLAAEAAGGKTDTANVWAAVGDGVKIDDNARIAVNCGKGLAIDTTAAPTSSGKDPAAQQTQPLVVNAGEGLEFNSTSSALQLHFANSGAEKEHDKAIRADDPRLTDDRNPRAHGATHVAGAKDQIDGLLLQPQKVNVTQGNNPVGISTTLNFTGAVKVSAPKPPPETSDAITIDVASPPTVRVLRNAGGDGQQGNGGEKLPCSLWVGVEDQWGRPVGSTPELPIKVRFAAALNEDTLIGINPATAPNRRIDVTPTGTDLIEVGWTLGQTPGCHNVEVTLVKGSGAAQQLPGTLALKFQAFALAVEQQQQQPRVAGAHWPNDEAMPMDAFQERGLQVDFTENMLEHGKSGFIVMVELPDPQGVGTQAVRVKGDVTSEDNKWTWRPSQEASAALNNLIGDLKSIPCRVVLDATRIYAADGKRQLDGEPKFAVDLPDGPTRFVQSLASGDGKPGGDFVSWFNLIPKA